MKDTLYLLTMPDIALLDQAVNDLKYAKNAVVSNFNRFEKENDDCKVVFISATPFGALYAAETRR